MIKTGKSYLHCLGSDFPQSIDLESRVKNVKRWITSKHSSWQVNFVPCIQCILANYMGQNKQMVFAIDGSEVANGCTALMISLVVGKRAIPICWVVRACKKGHLPAKMHLDLFTILHKLLEGYENVVILGDGEFDNHKVIQACSLVNGCIHFHTGQKVDPILLKAYYTYYFFLFKELFY